MEKNLKITWNTFEEINFETLPEYPKPFLTIYKDEVTRIYKWVDPGYVLSDDECLCHVTSAIRSCTHWIYLPEEI